MQVGILSVRRSFWIALSLAEKSPEHQRLEGDFSAPCSTGCQGAAFHAGLTQLVPAR
jgi:hypothetical protein